MQAIEITTPASRILFDNTQVRWTPEELLGYVTEAQRNIVQVRADAYPVTRVHPLVRGTRQSLEGIGALGAVNTTTGQVSGHTPEAMRLLRVNRNLGLATTGSPPTQATAAGSQRAVRPIGRETLDNERPDWHDPARANAVVEHYCFDNIDPTTFFVYPGSPNPPPGQSYFVELVYSGLPRRVEHVNQVLALRDQYLGIVLDWVLYRAYCKDSSYAGNLDRARTHIQNFSGALGIAVKAEWAAAIPPEKAAPAPRTPDPNQVMG